MEKSRRFIDLMVWQKAHRFVLSVYDFTKKFPKEEMYGLTSQFRRAAVSIPANIAEGYRKRGIKDKLRFFNISEGSAEECYYYLILAEDLGYGNTNDLKEMLDEVEKMLSAYSKTILSSIS
jgi:four helix bundle protein